MALTKVEYVDEETLIEAQNLNDIQDAIIELENSSATQQWVSQQISTAIGNAIEDGY